jgi:hypothetical protein
LAQGADVAGLAATDNTAASAGAAAAVSLSFDEWFGDTSTEAAGLGTVSDRVTLGGATHRAGRLGAGLHFSGGAPAVLTDSADGKSSTFTIALWARPAAPVEKQQLVLQRGGSRSGLIIAIVAGRWVAEGWHATPAPRLDLGPAVEGAWQHLAVSYDAATRTLRGYQDGIEVASARLEVGAAGDFTLGGPSSAGRKDSAFDGFRGDLDEFRFFPQAIEPAALATLALQPVKGRTP